MTPPNRGVSISHFCDNAIKQTTPKFTVYKSKHLYFLHRSAGPRFDSRLLWAQIYSPFLHVLLETSFIRDMFFSRQMASTWDAKPNWTSMFKASAHITSQLFTPHWTKQLRWPSPKSVGQENILFSQKKREVIEYLLNNLPVCLTGAGLGLQHMNWGRSDIS